MNEFPQTPPVANLAGTPASADLKLQVDPKLLTKATKKIKGLIHGNGLDVEKVSLCEKVEDTNITMFRFKARTALKLVPQYGIKIEPGRTDCR